MCQQSNSHLRRVVTDHKWAILITVTVITLSFFLHLKWCGSAMHYQDSQFDRLIDLHLNGYPFSLRPLTTYSVIALVKLGLTAKQSFFLLQFALAFLLALTFYRYLLTLGFQRNRANLALFLFLSAYPILAAHIAPVHTWDDFWAHLFTILSFTAAIKPKPTASIIWFTLACFAREQSFILLPALVITTRLFNRHRPISWMIALMAAPVVLYGVFYAFKCQPPRMDRFALILKNFETPLRASDTLFSVFISFGFAWVTTAIGLVHRGKSMSARFLWWGALLTLPATLVFTLFFTNARETRILFPPFLFVVPICAIVLHTIYRKLQPGIRLSRAVIGAAVFAMLMAGGIILGHLAFPAFEYRQCPNFNRLWAGVHFGLIFNLAAYTIRWGWSGFRLETKSDI